MRFLIAGLALVLSACAATTAYKPPTVGFRTGVSLLHDNTGVALGLQLYQPLSPTLDAELGTGLWSHTRVTDLNWDWHLGIRSCWSTGICFTLGADFLQNIDHLNGSHTNYFWSFSFPFFTRPRLAQWHISNAGTVAPNIGRNAVGLEWRCSHFIPGCGL